MKYALSPLTKPGGDDVDVMTTEGRERWIAMWVRRHRCTLEQATEQVDALIQSRKTTGDPVAEPQSRKEPA